MTTPLLHTAATPYYTTTTNNNTTTSPSAIHATRATAVSRSTVYLTARGLRAATGISSNYDTNYPVELQHIVCEKRFDNDIQQINHALADYWPCPTCFIGGYVCIPCTLGLSLLCPNICISGAESYVKYFIQDQINQRREYQEKHVTWSLHRSCGGGYVQIEYDVDSLE